MFGSYFPDREELALTANQLPAADAKETLRRLGFTTVIAHHKPNARVMRGEERNVLLKGRAMTAYDLTKRPPNTL